MALERFPEVHSRPAWRGHPRNNPLDRRAAPRHRLTAEAGIEAARTKITCRIHNISKSGALITLHLMLQPSDEVHLTLRSRDQPINGQVARVSDHGCGILFCA
nr:PilZ domain-containing protein [Halorhodospira halophila]